MLFYWRMVELLSFGFRVNTNYALARVTYFKTDYAVSLRKQGIILSDTDILAGMEMRSVLANEYITREHELTVRTLGSQALAVAVSAVT